MTMSTFMKESFYLGLAYSFRDLAYYHHGGRPGGTQADVVLEKELRVLQLHLQAEGKEHRWAWLRLLKPQSLSQGHTSSNKSTPPNPSQVPFPDDQASKDMSLWGPYLFKLP